MSWQGTEVPTFKERDGKHWYARGDRHGLDLQQHTGSTSWEWLGPIDRASAQELAGILASWLAGAA